jgi:ribosome-associated toxin RatA of RatAB toxin-antitoxin module
MAANRKTKQIKRQAIVGCPAALLYALVNSIESYPRWFEWCSSARLLSATESEMTAELGIKLAGISLQFATQNRLEPDRAIHLQLKSGPFQALTGAWQFEALGLSGCRVTLTLDLDFSASLVNSAVAAAAGLWADRLVDDFIRVAKNHV